MRDPRPHMKYTAAAVRSSGGLCPGSPPASFDPFQRVADNVEDKPRPIPADTRAQHDCGEDGAAPIDHAKRDDQGNRYTSPKNGITPAQTFAGWSSLRGIKGSVAGRSRKQASNPPPAFDFIH